MKLEQAIAIIERTPRRQRGNVLHDMAVASLASRPETDAATVLTALRQLGHPAADAFENLAWEASFERRRLTSASSSQTD